MLLSPAGEPVPRVLTTPGARELGYSVKRIRGELAHRRWQLLVRGVYLTRVDRPTRADWIMAGLAIAGPGAVLSGWDAVRARGIGSERAPVDGCCSWPRTARTAWSAECGCGRRTVR
jgi:hypothetical protein